MAAGKRAGLPFDVAWTLGEEAALSYISERKAREWHEALDATRDEWRIAYVGRDSRLADLTRR